MRRYGKFKLLETYFTTSEEEAAAPDTDDGDWDDDEQASPPTHPTPCVLDALHAHCTRLLPASLSYEQPFGCAVVRRAPMPLWQNYGSMCTVPHCRSWKVTPL